MLNFKLVFFVFIQILSFVLINPAALFKFLGLGLLDIDHLPSQSLILLSFSTSFLSLIVLFNQKRIMSYFYSTIEIKSNKNTYLSGLKVRLEGLAAQANIIKPPRLYYYPSNEINAFSFGSSRSNASIAISTGAIQNLTNEELESVLCHELYHVKNGDFVTMTLLCGFSDSIKCLSYKSKLVRENRYSENKFRRIVTTLSPRVLIHTIDIIVFGPGILIINFLNRKSEFLADSFAVRLMGTNQPLVSALRKISSQEKEEAFCGYLPPPSALRIASSPNSFISLFSTHPTIKKRIDNIQK